MKIALVAHSFGKAVIVVLLIAVFALNSCSSTGPATKITGSWKDPESTNYKDFFVAVLSKNHPARSTFEQDISKRLKREGVKVTQSLEVFAHSDKLDTKEEKMAAVEKIQSLGHDAIITVALVKQTEEERYVPGANSYAPTNVGVGSGYYNPARGEVPAGGTPTGFGGYYIDGSSTYTTPGYYEMDKNYFIVCNVYDTKTSKLIWSAQSETFNPGNLSNASAGFSLVMVDAMKKSKLIFNEKEKK